MRCRSLRVKVLARLVEDLAVVLAVLLAAEAKGIPVREVFLSDWS
jgi:hypothetical protein